MLNASEPAQDSMTTPGGAMLPCSGGEPAMTIVPNLFASSVLTVLAALTFGVWAVRFIEHRNGGFGAPRSLRCAPARRRRICPSDPRTPPGRRGHAYEHRAKYARARRPLRTDSSLDCGPGRSVPELLPFSCWSRVR